MATDVALQQAIQALRAGERAAAQTMLHTFTEAQPSQPDGWLWLAAACDDVDHKRTYLLRAQALRPRDPRVLAALRALDGGARPVAPEQPMVERPAPVVAQPAAPPAPAAAAHPLAAPRFVTTGVRSRRPISWRIVALASLLVVAAIPLLLLLTS
jgi:hypothetical protein